MSDSECLTIDEGKAHQILIDEAITTIEVGKTFRDTRGLGMDKAEFDKLLPTLPPEEHRSFHDWFVAYQDYVSWEQFKGQGYKHIMKVKEDIENHILNVTGKPQQLKLAFMPSSMARTSPFFPMGKQEMKDRPLYRDFIIENSWGKITFSGPRLSIFDESVLLALLVLAKKCKSDNLQTTYVEMCEIMSIPRGGKQYLSISDALIRLAKSTIETNLTGGKRKESVSSFTGAILSQVNQDFQTKKISIFINPHFLALYGVNLTTYLDVGERAQLKGDTAKALYRFIQTHKPGPVPFGLLTLCHGINLNTDQPLFEIRRQIKTALAELKKHGHIKSGRIDKTDNIYLTKP